MPDEKVETVGDVRIVFDGPPGPVAGRFVEVEGPGGCSIRLGKWHERSDGLWELRIPAILGPICPTCGGELEVWAMPDGSYARISGKHRPNDGRVKPCPTCHGKHPKPYIVTREALTDGAFAMYVSDEPPIKSESEAELRTWFGQSVAGIIRHAYERRMLAALTALGPFEVVDETCNIVSKRVMLELTRVIPNVPDVDESCVIELHSGDRIHIKRGESEGGHARKEE